eukprot:TRINITY_DN8472_c0_g1_i1.p1 TRINITY_DN8472_c0_g1~~TRINITY_DN8472_c0_g1_i1.p1  ORF type:complete len:568 (-),score=78.39 TRINITY_DN8472_c0_g1_i1:93-1745(-)
MIRAENVKGIRGLMNLGNTSFMNSALQCALHTQCLVDYFLSGLYRSDINRSNPLGSGGNLCEEFAALMREMWSDEDSSIKITRFKDAIVGLAPQFAGYQQQNSAEFLSCLLDILSEDLNRILRKPYVTWPTFSETDNQYEAAEESMKKFLFRNMSIIVEKFIFQLKSRVFCPQCSKVYISFDPCLILTLPIPLIEHTLKITFVRYYNVSPIVRFGVKVTLESTAKDIKLVLSQISGVSHLQMVIAEVRSNRIHHIFEDGVTVCDFGENIVCYETPELGNNHTMLKIEFKNQDSVDFYRIPLLLWIDHLEKLNSRDLYNMVSDFISVKNDPLENPFYLFVGKDPLVKNDESSPVQFSEQKEPKALTLMFDASFDVLNSYKSKENTIDHESVQDSLRDKKLTLHDCFEEHRKSRKLSPEDAHYCQQCKAFVEADKKVELWNTPPILVVSFDRFLHKNPYKIETSVEAPLDNLDLSNFVLDREFHAAKYELFAVCLHYGRLGGGHYASLAKCENNDWYSLDDTWCQKVSEEKATEMCDKNAYILFYKKKGEEL